MFLRQTQPGGNPLPLPGFSARQVAAVVERVVMRCQNCYSETCTTLNMDGKSDKERQWSEEDCKAWSELLPRGWFCPCCNDGLKLTDGETCIYCGMMLTVGDELPF